MLQHLGRQTKDLLTSKNERKLQRHQTNLSAKIEEAHALVTSLVEIKIEQGLKEEEITEWSADQEETLELYEESLGLVENELNGIKHEEESRKLDEIEAREEQRRVRILREEEHRRERQREIENQLEDRRLERLKAEQQTAKLPKLEISKFKGTPLDWVRFWEQFESEVDKVNKAPITKFSYLRELLTDQPRSEILGLPFSEEGYTQVKEILKRKYGVTSEIVQAHGRQIMKLPNIVTGNLKQVHEFYRKLNVSINSLKTLKKLVRAEILVREALEKLGPVKTDLIRTDPKWQQWKFEDLLEALREYTLRNPEKIEDTVRSDFNRQNRDKMRREKHFRTTDKTLKKAKCVYCDSNEHKSSECDKLKEVSERRESLKTNQLCYNCTGKGHGVGACKSRSCGNCGERHHTSLCPKKSRYLIGATKETIHPTLVIVANGEKFRVTLDTGAGSSFASSTFIQHLGVKPSHWEQKNIETVTTTVQQNLPVYEVRLWSTDGSQCLDVKLNKLDRPVITTLNNPRIADLKRKYSYRIHFDCEDERDQHPVHLILGVGDITRTKTACCKIGGPDEPIAEKTTLGWTIMGPGKMETNSLYFTKTSQEDYRQLYSLDVLGLEDRFEGDQSVVHEEFKEQLERKPDGTYSTGLPWKEGHPQLPDNSTNAKARLNGLL